VFDVAYREFIRSPDTPKSIFEIPGAREVAIETGSFSKLIGFTGVRCGWTVVPKDVKFDNGSSLHSDWSRIQSTYFNGPSNLSEAGSLASLSPEGQVEMKAMVDFYMENASIVKKVLNAANITSYGGEDSPYIWMQVPGNKDSWTAFQELLDNAHVVTTPGAGFGPNGNRFLRISCFAHREDVLEAANRIGKHFGLV